MTTPKFIIIVPIKNRNEQKFFWKKNIDYILEDYEKSSYKIFFVNQLDDNVINRGALRNIGFLVCREIYHKDYKNINFVFWDVDNIPYKKNLLNFNTIKGSIKHLYGHQRSLGGIISIKGEDFEDIKGYPNMTGWGFEDVFFKKNALVNNKKIDYSNFYFIENQAIIHLFDEQEKLINFNELKEMEENPLNLKNKNFLQEIYNLDYEVKNEDIMVKKFNIHNKSSNEIHTKINPGIFNILQNKSKNRKFTDVIKFIQNNDWINPLFYNYEDTKYEDSNYLNNNENNINNYNYLENNFNDNNFFNKEKASNDIQKYLNNYRNNKNILDKKNKVYNLQINFNPSINNQRSNYNRKTNYNNPNTKFAIKYI